MSSRPLHSAERLEARRHKRKRRAIAIGLVFLVFLGGVVALSNQEWLLISEIRIQNETVTEERELRTVINEALDGRWLLVFPKRNGLLYPQAELTAAIRATFPRIAEVHIERPNPRTLDLTLSERQPYALWCGVNYADGATGDEALPCYFLDVEGVVFARAPEFSGHGYFTYYGALVTEGSAPTRAEEGAGDVVDSTATTPIGKKFLTADRFVQLSKLIFVLDNEVLREFDLSPIALLAVSNGADYEILLEGGARLLISAQSDLALTAANIRSALSSPSLDDTLSGGKRLDVIDVRFGNRVYYTVK